MISLRRLIRLALVAFAAALAVASSMVVAKLDPAKVAVVFLCNSMQARCIPPSLGSDVSDLVFEKQATTFLVFADARTADVAAGGKPNAQRGTSLEAKLRETNKNTVLVPCDITDTGGAPSLLSCVSDAVLAALDGGLKEDQQILFLSGAAVRVPDTALTQLADALINNRLAAVSAVSIARASAITPPASAIGAHSFAGAAALSPSSPPFSSTDYFPTTVPPPASSIGNNKSADDADGALFVVFSAGLNRQPLHRSVLGGFQNVISADGLGVDAHEESLRELRGVDAIDFTASLVTAQAFVQAALHGPASSASVLSANHPGQSTMTLRALEWCPSSVEELLWVTQFLAEAIDDDNNNSNNNDDDPQLRQRLHPGSNNNRKKSSSSNKNKPETKLAQAKRQFALLPSETKTQLVRQVKTALEWLESVDSDACLARSRFGVRFDALFEAPVAPAAQFGGPAGLLREREGPIEFAASLLQRLSSVLLDATFTSQIVLATESVAALGNSMAVLPSLQVEVDAVSPSTSTITYPSRPPTSVAAALLSAPSNGGNNNGGNNAGNGKPSAFPLVVIWDVYCCRCCGFSSEIELLIADLKRCTVYLTAHVDCFCTGQREGERMALESKFVTVERLAAHPPTDVTVFISHSQPFLFQTFWLEQHPCDYRIARTMLEASRIPDDWVTALKNSVNEVWCTTQQQRTMFVQSGVPASKVFVVPEAVDTERLDPDAVAPFEDIDAAAAEHGWNFQCTRPRKGKQKRRNRKQQAGENNNNNAAAASDDEGHYIFFGNFKWEDRKSPDTLLSAYFDAFVDGATKQAREDVSLYVLTSAFMDKDNPRNQIPILQMIEQWARVKFADEFPDEMPPEMKRQRRRLAAAAEDTADDDGDDGAAAAADGGDDEHGGEGAAHRKQLDEEDDRRHAEEIYSFQHAENDDEKDQQQRRRRLARHRAFLHWIRHTPRVCLIVDLLPDDQMDRLYASADAFVLATRGEGWALPAVQAMSLGVPVITTGAEMVPFITDHNIAYLIDLDGYEVGMEAERMPGAKWAIPSVAHLTQLLRHVLGNRDEAAAVGARGRAFVVQKYSVRVVAGIIERRLSIVANFVSSLYR